MSLIARNFVMAVESGNLARVQHILLQNAADVNGQYLGVLPLQLAVQQGDVDMAALLLTAGADPTVKPNQRKDTHGLIADIIKEGPKTQKHWKEVKLIKELIENPKKCKAHHEEAQKRVLAQNAKDLRRAKYAVAIFMGLCAIAYGVYFSKLKLADEL
jgi:ankyrin repeat protein